MLMCGSCDTIGTISVGFSRERFHEGAHMCLVFRDESERREIVSKFVQSGLLEGERVLYFADIVEPREVVDWLGTLDVDVSPALASQAFSVDAAAETYCPDGTFDPDRMCGKLKDAYSTAKTEGYPMARVTGEMSWALRGYPGSERLMEYEARINKVVQTHPITAMCQYDANKFDGDLIFKALQVHPYMVMNAQLVKNPYYVGAE
jgi:hypothetical protein